MRYKIIERTHAGTRKAYFQVVDTQHTLTKDGDYEVDAFNDLHDAKICIAKLNGIKGAVLSDGRSVEYGTDRFELEQLITLCGDVESDIDALIDRIERQGTHPLEIAGTLKSIKNLHSLRYERVFDYFNEMIKKGYIKSNEIYEEV